MLTTAQRTTLLGAVPSFAPRWAAYERDQREYISRFPEEALSEHEWSLEFLWEMASHVAGRLNTGSNEGELGALFTALEEIYAVADAELYSLLTLSLLERLIMELEHEGDDAAKLQQYIEGPLTKRAWGAAWNWMHG